MSGFLRRYSVFSLAFLAGVICSCEVLLWVGGSIHWWFSIPTGFFMGLTALFLVDLAYPLPTSRARWVPVFTACLVMGTAAALASRTITLSGDSVTDHMPTVHHLAKGWNPIYDPMVQAPGVSNGFYMNSEADYGTSIGKLLHFTGALAYQLTGYIESGKCLNWFLPLTIFFAIFYLCLCIGFRRAPAVGFAIFCGFAPGIINQVNSFYVDSGLLGLLLLLVVAQYAWFESRDRGALAIALLALFLLPHAKLTGLPLGVLLSMPLLLRALRQGVAGCVSALLFAIVFFAFLYHPYGSNYRLYNNAFYPMPAKRSEARWIAASSQDSEIYRLRPMMAFWKTLTSRSEVAGVFTPKLPWQVHRNETVQAGQPDARVAGFGPLFGLSFFLSASFFALFFLMGLKPPWYWILPTSLCVITVLSAPVTYWLRYVPQTYVFCALVLLFALHWAQKNRDVFSRALSSSLWAVGFANVFLVGYGAFHFVENYNHRFRDVLQVLRNYGKPLDVDFDSNRHGNKVVLLDNGIQFREVPKCSENWMAFSFASICKPHSEP